MSRGRGAARGPQALHTGSLVKIVAFQDLWVLKGAIDKGGKGQQAVQPSDSSVMLHEAHPYLLRADPVASNNADLACSPYLNASRGCASLGCLPAAAEQRSSRAWAALLLGLCNRS
eukprot:633392-Rhodomonas_salina.1